MLWQSCAGILHGGVSAGIILAFLDGFPKYKYSGLAIGGRMAQK
jgi:hypothetical protein